MSNNLHIHVPSSTNKRTEIITREAVNLTDECDQHDYPKGNKNTKTQHIKATSASGGSWDFLMFGLQLRLLRD